MEVNLTLKRFKTPDGNVNWGQVATIPRYERIPQMAETDHKRILMLIIGAVTIATESIAFTKPMTGIQVLDLSEAIIDTASEDNLAFEDLMLFLQKMVRGEYDMSTTSIDIPRFMKMFEVYRQQRWENILRLRYDQHEQLKWQGNTGKTSNPDPLSEHFAKLGNRMAEMKSHIGRLKEENNSLKMDNL